METVIFIRIMSVSLKTGSLIHALFATASDRKPCEAARKPIGTDSPTYYSTPLHHGMTNSAFHTKYLAVYVSIRGH